MVSLDFSKDFITFPFASEDNIAAILLQKNAKGFEQPISFFSKVLRDSELKYNILEKQPYALVKALKFFRIYLLHSKKLANVPNASVKEILTQHDSEGKRGHCIEKIMEYDVEISPTKLVKRQGVEKLLTDSNFQALRLNVVFNEVSKREKS